MEKVYLMNFSRMQIFFVLIEHALCNYYWTQNLVISTLKIDFFFHVIVKKYILFQRL